MEDGRTRSFSERRRPFEAWLAPDNLDAAGVQRQPLSAFMRPRLSAMI
jgi:hypothetical protein